MDLIISPPEPLSLAYFPVVEVKPPGTCLITIIWRAKAEKVNERRAKRERADWWVHRTSALWTENDARVSPIGGLVDMFHVRLVLQTISVLVVIN